MPVMTSAKPRITNKRATASGPRRGYAVAQAPQVDGAGDGALHQVARFEEARRGAVAADPGGGAGADQIAGFQGQVAADVGDQARDVMDEVAGQGGLQLGSVAAGGAGQ